MKFNKIGLTKFEDSIYKKIKEHENFVPKIYADHKGIPTLGVGYAILIEEEKKMGDQPEAEINTMGAAQYKNILEEDEGELTEQKVEEMMKEWMQNGEEM